MADDRDELDDKAVAQLGAVLYAVHQIRDRAQIKDGCDSSLDLVAMAAPKAGSVRYTRINTGEVVMAQPRDAMYSTACMLAEAWFNSEKWVKHGDL